MARTFKETKPQKQDFIKKHETAMMWNHPFLLPFFNYITVSRISTFLPLLKVHYSALRKVIPTLIPGLLQTSPYRRICIMTDLRLVYFIFKTSIKLFPDKQEIHFPTVCLLHLKAGTSGSHPHAPHTLPGLLGRLFEMIMAFGHKVNQQEHTFSQLPEGQTNISSSFSFSSCQPKLGHVC